jgi:hypothetical protein
MHGSIVNGIIEWCWRAEKPLNTIEEQGWPETKCPDLGDWSDTPHDELDGELVSVSVDIWSWVKSGFNKAIDLDRERLMAYTYD